MKIPRIPYCTRTLVSRNLTTFPPQRNQRKEKEREECVHQRSRGSKAARKPGLLQAGEHRPLSLLCGADKMAVAVRCLSMDIFLTLFCFSLTPPSVPSTPH
ncbi:hypothetical protein CEXT_188341 [Caerostris extrusa]|uniref:Uncharacterized protein n=1 Tax=Caerostris extrusa TaxID=172846 RepID=A0AAV4TD69_CAEEX|nr:hypothetical protein CEXT_188341 [Caerostris extrusa]